MMTGQQDQAQNYGKNKIYYDLVNKWLELEKLKQYQNFYELK